MAKESADLEIRLKDVRLSFLNCFAPQKFVDEKTGTERYTYNTNILIPKKLADGSPNPQVKELAEAMKTALAKTWPDGKKVIPPERRCVRDGEPVDPDTIERDDDDNAIAGTGTKVPLYDGYEGHIFVSANRSVDGPESPNPVQLLGPKKTAKNDRGDAVFPRLKQADGLLYSGCYANVIIRIYGYDGKGKNPDRINASLEAIQFKRHGEAFGAKPIDADVAFDEEDDDDGMEVGGGASASEADDLLG